MNFTVTVSGELPTGNFDHGFPSLARDRRGARKGRNRSSRAVLSIREISMAFESVSPRNLAQQFSISPPGSKLIELFRFARRFHRTLKSRALRLSTAQTSVIHEKFFARLVSFFSSRFSCTLIIVNSHSKVKSYLKNFDMTDIYIAQGFF